MSETEKTELPPDYTATSGTQAPPYPEQATPGYGQPAATQPQYGQPPVTQPQYGQVNSGFAPQPQYGQPPPPPPGYTGSGAVMYNANNPPGGIQSSTVIITQPGVIGGQNFGPSPMTITCQYCNSSVTTGTSRECGIAVWVYCGIICLIGLAFPLLWLGCCFIPFCIPALYNKRHWCPNCQKQVGMYRGGGM